MRLEKAINDIQELFPDTSANIFALGHTAASVIAGSGLYGLKTRKEKLAVLKICQILVLANDEQERENEMREILGIGEDEEPPDDFFENEEE